MAVEIETLPQPKLNFAERHPALEEILRKGQFPEEIAFIPDGNRRWAKERGLDPWEGHLEGLQNMIRVTREYSDSPVKRLLLWGSSVDNLSKRPEAEIHHLNEYTAMGLEQTAQELIEDNARLIHVGNKDLLGSTLGNLLEKIESASSENTGQTIYLALAYGGADHDRRQKRKIAQYAASAIRQNPQVNIDSLLTDDVLDSFADGDGNWKNMDLLIRTTTPKNSWDISEEKLQAFHLSGIGDVVGPKTIVVPIPKFFPDLRNEDIDSAILAFANSERKQGK